MIISNMIIKVKVADFFCSIPIYKEQNNAWAKNSQSLKNPQSPGSSKLWVLKVVGLQCQVFKDVVPKVICTKCYIGVWSDREVKLP